MANLDQFLRSRLETPEFSTLPLAGDASTRRYYRVVSGEKSWVLMEWEPFEKPKDFPFLSVQHYFQKHKIPVPEVLAFCEKEGLFLLEDLGDLTLERKFWEFQNQENILPYYESTLDELVKIHSLSFGDQKKSCTAYDVAFTQEKLLWEFHYMKEHLLEKKFQIPMSAIFSKALEVEFTEICRRLSSLPRVICHRDFHSRNVMIKHGRIQIIDFQDARMGPAVYDLVSLLLDSYVELNEETIQILMKRYRESFTHWAQITKDAETFQKEFDLQAIQRCLKACGSFASFFNTRADSRYLKHIPKTLEIVESKLKNFSDFPRLTELMAMTRPHWQGFIE